MLLAGWEAAISEAFCAVKRSLALESVFGLDVLLMFFLLYMF
jgi:hypothetical protein